jgi:hypothetical protein
MTTNLAEKTCTSCRSGVPPRTAQQAEELRVQAPVVPRPDRRRRLSFYNRSSARNAEPIHALRRPASEKRQGTKFLRAAPPTQH